MSRKRKILTIAGTRPEVIRLSEVIKKLDLYTDHIFIHTGQNFSPSLHEQFFKDLNLRLPDYQLNIKEQRFWIEFIAYMLIEVEKILILEKPEAVLILWDTNSGLSAYVCKKLKIPVFHMEAGNRCYDTIPEEINRAIIDSLSSYLLPYTQRSREQLLREWYHPSKIIVTGNPISEIVKIYESIYKERKEKEPYILVTLHRDENITKKESLLGIIDALNKLSKHYKIIVSNHPKLADMLSKFEINTHHNIELREPTGLKEFLNLEKFALCVLSDSWTVPEECSIFKVPCILMRTSTERPELLENNSMILSGIKTDEILNAFEVAKSMPVGDIPSDYVNTNVSDKIVKIMLRNL